MVCAIFCAVFFAFVPLQCTVNYGIQTQRSDFSLKSVCICIDDFFPLNNCTTAACYHRVVTVWILNSFDFRCCYNIIFIRIWRNSLKIVYYWALLKVDMAHAAYTQFAAFAAHYSRKELYETAIKCGINFQTEMSINHRQHTHTHTHSLVLAHTYIHTYVLPIN